MRFLFDPRPPWVGNAVFVRAWLCLALAAYLLLVILPALRMPGFAEDLGLVHDLAAYVEKREWFPALMLRWTGPLWGPGSLMWRPWGFTSLMIDAWLWGPVGEYWHFTNLALHVATAALTGILAFRLTGGSQLASIVAGSVFLLNPWSGETTFWLVGRFDSWATFFCMAALVSLTGQTPSLRAVASSLFCGAAALLSKESAMLLPALVALTLLGARQSYPARSILMIVTAHGLLLALYLALRRSILGTVSTAAYGEFGASLFELPMAIVHHLGALFPLDRWGGVVLLGLLLSIYLGLRQPYNRRQTIALVTWLLLVVTVVARFSAEALPYGEGMRFYHLGLPTISCIYGLGFAAAWATIGYETRAAGLSLGLLAMALIALGIGAVETTQRWKSVGQEIVSTAYAVAKVARHHQQDLGYGLVVLPDNLKPVPTLRAAQGGIVYLAQRLDPRMPQRGLDYVVGMTDRQFDEWATILAEPVVSKLTQRSDAPPRPTQFWCVHHGQPIALGHWPHEPLSVWRANWKASLSRSCPGLLGPD